MTSAERDLQRTPLRAARVAVLADRFPELSETFVIDQVGGLRAQGLEVDVLAERRPSPGPMHPKGLALRSHTTYASDHRWLAIAERIGLPKVLQAKLRRLAAQRRDYDALARYDVVLCHFGPNGLRAARQARRLGPRGELWTIFHGYDITSYIRRHGRDAYDPLFKAGDRFLAVSQRWATVLAELGCPPEKVHVLRMGVDCGKERFRPRAALAGQPVRLLSVCRLVEKKGLTFGLDALDLLTKRGVTGWRYDIIGSGPLEADLRRQATALGLTDQVSFLGPMPADAVQRHLQDADIFLLPSVTAASGDMEGIPVALMEAMASGAAVASSVHSGIPELVDHEVSGLLAAERDSASLADNLQRLIEEPALRAKLAKAAHAKVEAEFNQAVIIQRLADDLNEAARKIAARAS